MEAIAFLSNVLTHHFICFDHEGHIAGEYERCKQRTSSQRKAYPGRELISSWLAAVIRRKARYNYSGQLQDTHRQYLQGLAFDPSDMPFVAVCYRTPDKLLVAEESDYTSAVKAYLSGSMGIQVLTIAQALERV
jgi:hypothetical protein